MKKRTARFAVAMMAAVVAVTALTANAESFTYEGRYLGSDGEPVVSTTKAATLNVYTGETTSTAAGSAQITIATDSEGYFATTADVALSGADGADTFWLGVTPEGGSEIRPRMRMSPAPFAIRAASARVLEVDGDLRLDGTVSITTLANADKLIPNSIVTTKPLSIDEVGLENVGNLTIGEIYPGHYDMTGSLSMLHTGNGAVPNFHWDEFPAEVTMEVEARANSFNTGKKEIAITEDGVALIMVRTYNETQSNCEGHWFYYATLSSGQSQYFLYNTMFETGEISSYDNWMGYSSTHCYVWSVPVLRGKKLTIAFNLENFNSRVGVQAKVQFVYFGAAK